MNTHSEQLDKIIPALVAAQKVIKQPIKNATNPHFRNKFADLGACLDVVRGPLNDNGIFLSQIVTIVDGKDVLCTTLFHESGQWIASTYAVGAAQATPQAFGSALTYSRRYSLCGLLGLFNEDDDDANEASAQAAASRAAFVAKATGKKTPSET